jgi:steroid delta-isomerase-like uncharacterized protein
MTITKLLLPLALVFVAPLPVEAKPGKDDCSAARRAEIEALVDNYIEIYSEHDLARLDEVVTPDSLNHNPFGVMTVEQLSATMEGFYAAFPDLEYQLVQYTFEGDRLVIEYTYTGTHLGPLLGVPATGTVVQGRGLEIHTLAADGRIAATNNYSDVFGLFVQLGLI